MNYGIFLINSDTLAWTDAVTSLLVCCKEVACCWTAVSLDICKESSSFSWQTAEELSEEKLKDLNFRDSITVDAQNSLTTLQQAADHLHSAADNLPAYGCLVDIYLWPPKDIGSSDYTLLLGSLRRLKDWHNASITIFDRDLIPETEFLQKFLSATVCFEDKFEPNSSDAVFWRGKMSVCDKIDNKGLTVPGITMTKLTQDTPTLAFPLPHPQQTGVDKDDSPCLLGRMLEVLDEVNLSTVPSILTTNHTYRLCLYQKHPYAQVLMNYIQQSLETGLLTRLAVYPQNKKLPICQDTNLSTDSWKENIMADIQFVQEPEEDYQDNYEFLYFVITSPDKNSSTESFTAHAHLLRSPYQLSGDIVDMVYDQILVKKQKNEIDVNLDNLPVISWVGLKKIHSDLLDIQNSYLKDWIATRKRNNQSTIVSVAELNSCLLEIRKRFLDQLSTVLPVLGVSSETTEPELGEATTEASLNSMEWTERQIQQYNESQRRSLSRICSTESMPMSSPIQTSDTTKTVDIQDFLKFFNPDGSAAADNLSPIRRKPSSRAHTRKAQTYGADPSKANWPESKDIEDHDIYYNTNKRSEKVNDHLNKLRDRWVKDDTLSSCTSSQVVFPKPTRQKQTVTTSPELRRSPRKKAPRSVFDENFTMSQKAAKMKTKVGRLSDSKTPLASIQQSEGRRRFSTPYGLNSESHSVSFSQPSTSHHSSAARRRSEISHSQSATPLPRQVKKLRRESDIGIPGSTSQSQPIKTESRSERHKRKLQEIVDEVLNDNGVSRDDPIFQSCSTRLFKVTKLFVMDLPTSRNLKQEMRKIAESQVKQVIEVDRARRKSLDATR